MKRAEKAGVVGFLGSVFAALCCLGIPAIIAFVGAIGAGFLVRDQILIPLLGVSLALSLVGIIGSYRQRHQKGFLILGVLAAITTFLSVALGSSLGSYVGLLLLLTVTLWPMVSKLSEYHRHQSHHTS